MRHAATISLAILMSLGLAPATMGAAEKGGPPPPRASAAAPRPQEVPLTSGGPTSAPTTAPAANDIAPDDDKPEEKGKMEPKEEGGRGTALPIPRFVSLRTDPINLRTGPGVRYPVEDRKSVV